MMKKSVKYCPNCHSMTDADEAFCSMCGTSLDDAPSADIDIAASDESSYFNLNHISVSGSRFALIYAAVFAAVGFLGGIILGFNLGTMFMIYAWITTLLLLVIIQFIYYHFRNQEKIIELLSKQK